MVNQYFISDTGAHFLNDLALDDMGNIYITDTKFSAIYYLAAGKDDLTIFHRSPEIIYPNGITISEDQSKLYVASYLHGVRIIDIKTKTILNSRDTTKQSMGIDGLEYYQGNLYAIQNGIPENTDNFRKLILSENEDELIDMEIIESHSISLRLPLTFCILNHQAMVIANSNLEFLDQVKMEIIHPDSLSPTVLRVYDIN